MTKLYEQDKHQVKNISIESVITYPERETTLLDELFNLGGMFLLLEDNVNAYNSLNVVYEQVATESFSFIDKGNYVLYNEYIKSITAKLDVKPVFISQEAIDTLPTVAINHHISLEGFIKDIWEKIKGVFRKIYDSVKAFFVRWFTRLGRIKKKLENIKEVLGEINKDISKSVLDSVPGGLASKFPISGTISYTEVESVFNNAVELSNALVLINKKAVALSKKDVIDKDFVNKVKSLKETARLHKEQIGKNDANISELGKSKLPLASRFRSKEEKENDDKLGDENTSLKKIAEDSEKEADEKEGNLKEIVNDNIGVEFDETEFTAAQKELKDLYDSIEKEFNKLKGKPLIEGQTITEVKVTDDGIDITIDTNKDKPSEINLSNKSGLVSLINKAIDLLKNSEDVSKNYGEVNESVIKNLDTVDKLMIDLDKINEGDLGKYKTILTNKVKHRLTFMKNFFRDYNKVNKNIFEINMSSAEAVADYAVLSMKHFG